MTVTSNLAIRHLQVPPPLFIFNVKGYLIRDVFEIDVQQIHSDFIYLVSFDIYLQVMDSGIVGLLPI